RIVATASSSGVVKSSSQWASGWVAASVRSMRPTRRDRPSAGSPAAIRLARRAALRAVAVGAVVDAVGVLREAMVTGRAYGSPPTAGDAAGGALPAHHHGECRPQITKQLRDGNSSTPGGESFTAVRDDRTRHDCLVVRPRPAAGDVLRARYGARRVPLTGDD